MQERVRVQLDSKNRVPLTKVLGENNYHVFHAYKEGERIILEPISEVPTHELWLYRNPKALSSVIEGMEQALRGEVCSLGSFAQYIEDVQEEDDI